MQEPYGVRIYPNPARDYIIIESSASESVHGKVYSLTGQLILQFNTEVTG